jgi:hypothetical protein
VTTPTTEPGTLYTGDTWAWTRTLADYPASAGWTLKYTLINATHRINITGTADGDAHVISVAAATTAAYSAGSYTWQAFVEKSAERFTVGNGSVTVKLGLSSGSGGSDQRTQAQEAMEDALAALASYTATSGMVSEYEIAGRRMKFRSLDEIRRLVNFWRREVQGEIDAERIRLGLGTSRKIYTRFGS